MIDEYRSIRTLYKETRRTTIDRIRSVCIKYGFYIDGSNEEYETLLSYGEKECITTDDIIMMAADIWVHSYTIDMSVETVMNIIANECCYTTFEVI